MMPGLMITPSLPHPPRLPNARSRAALLRRIEAMAVRGRECHWSLMPPEVSRRLGAGVARFGDAFATRLTRSHALRSNRVIGFGHRGGASQATLDAIVGWYRDAGVRRFSLLLGPGPQAARIGGWLEARGFRHHEGYVMLLRPPAPAPRARRGTLRVRRASRAEAGKVVDLYGGIFGYPPSHRAWMIASAVGSGQEHYLARIGATTVGAGTIRIERDLAWLGGGATLPRWRKRGAHAALIVARLRRAARAGCRWVWVETSAPVPGHPDGSRRNLLSLGFAEVARTLVFVRELR